MADKHTSNGPGDDTPSRVAPVGQVDYESVSDDYLEKRQLPKGAAGWILLAGLGVSYVISGDFAGWNFGLAQGGFYHLSADGLPLQLNQERYQTKCDKRHSQDGRVQGVRRRRPCQGRISLQLWQHKWIDKGRHANECAQPVNRAD